MPRPFIFAIGLLIFTCTTASAQEPGRPWWAATALTAHATSHALDLVTTNVALRQNPNAVEMNPVLRPFVDQPWAFGSVSAGLWIGANYTLWKVAKSHPKRATFIAVALSAAEMAIASHNVSVMRAAPPLTPLRPVR
jgi:Domain of unknown function (DUF5658)